MFDIHSFILQIFFEYLPYVITILVSGESEVSYFCAPQTLYFSGGRCAINKKFIHADEKYESNKYYIEFKSGDMMEND